MLGRSPMGGLGTIALWAAMIAAVGVCASGSYEHVVIVPQWTEAPPQSIAMFHGPHALDTGQWWRMVHLPSVLLCATALLLLRGHPRRLWIGASLVGYVLLLIVTGVWILPELIALTSDPLAAIPRAQWQQRAERWEKVSLVRLALMYTNAGLLVSAAAIGASSHRTQPESSG